MPPRKSKQVPLPVAPRPLTFKEHCVKWTTGCGADECSRSRNRVFARGKLPCDLLFVGEGPGVSEDVLARPFVGHAGELLQRIIDDAVPQNVTWCLTNVVCCIPRDEEGNKSGEPNADQVMACAPRLKEFVTLADPRLIVCVGSVASQWLDAKYLHAIRFDKVIPQVHIKHPAALLRETVASRELSIQRAVVVVSTAVTEMRETSWTP